jgi:membrane peptidoglycan carboxypeptidase
MPEPHDDRVPPNRVLSHLWVMALVSVVMGVVVAGLAIPFAGIAGLAARDMSDALSQLPEDLDAKEPAQRTRILAADGTEIATLYDENRVNVSLTQVSKVMRQAILSIEDYRFYEHGALDVRGTIRALLTNQASGGVVQGGSSITQQLVKLTLISQAKTQEEIEAASETTLARKIRELRYAIAFEQKHSKDWILERYLNLAYFGDGVYGIQAAARHYFRKDAKDLELAEAALLAGLVKHPVGYDPTVYPDRALDRRNVVLERMAELNVISIKKAQRAANSPLGLHLDRNRNGCMFSRAPFFCDFVVNWLKADPALGKTEKQREELLTSGGLTIQTTIDLRFQDAADTAVRRHVFATDTAIGALAMVEPRTGNVRAIAQSRPMGSDRETGQTFLNYAVNQKYGDSAGFSAGSTFKAFVLSAAIKQNIPLTTTLYAPGEIFMSESEFEDCDGDPYGFGTWDPENYDGAGRRVNLYTGTALSVNTFFAQIEAQTGLCEPFRLAKQMGVDLTNPTGDGAERVPSFTLGTPNASPLEMAEAYATFAGEGLHCSSRPVTEILDSNGTVVKEYPKECTQVLASDVANAVNDVLQGVTAPGGFAQYIATTQPSAGKTGTAQNATSVWFIGYTPNLAAAAMIAGVNADGQPIELGGQTVGGIYRPTASGSGFAGPIWGDAMAVVEQWLEDIDFVAPDATAIAGLLVTVPDVGGMSVEQATQVLEDAGFIVSVAGFRDSAYERGTVAFTNPRGGGQLSSGDTVVIYISDGTPFVPPKKGDKGDDDEPTDGPGNGNGNGNGGGNGGGPGNGNDGDDGLLGLDL